LHEQYLRFEGSERVDFLGDAAEETWRRLTSMALPDPGVLVRALAPAVAAKHVMVASTRPEELETLVALGIAADVPSVRGDFLGVVTQNAGPNKIDWFLRRRIDYEVTTGGGQVDATLRLALHNTAPVAGLPEVLLGSGYDGLPTGTNRLYLSIYSPWGLAGATIDKAAAAFESEVEFGRNVYSTYVDIPAGSTTVIELQLAGALTDHYGLTVLRQPMPTPDQVMVTIDGVERRFRLDADRRIVP
jgi:hypothetical protein